MQQDQALSGLSMAAARKRFAVCLRNEGYEIALEKRKIYEVLADPGAAEHDQIRAIDESREDYRYPEKLFAEIEPSAGAKSARRERLSTRCIGSTDWAAAISSAFEDVAGFVRRGSPNDVA